MRTVGMWLRVVEDSCEVVEGVGVAAAWRCALGEGVRGVGS